MKKINSILTWLLVTIAVLLVILFVLPVIPMTKNLYQAVIVQSGSMEPTIPTGSIVLYKPTTDLKVDDIAVFKNQSTAEEVVTIHRIIEVQSENDSPKFITKGDANDVADSVPLDVSVMLGRVFITVPVVGYVVAWMQTTAGRFLLIVLPLSLVGYHEINSFIQRKQKKTEVKTTEPITEKNNEEN